MAIGIYERPVYDVICSVCGSSYIQRRRPVENAKCKKCQKKIDDVKYRESHYEKIKQQAKLYRDSPINKHRIQENRKAYYLKNRGKISEKCKTYYQDNKEAIKARSIKYKRDRGARDKRTYGIEILALPFVQEHFQDFDIVLKDNSILQNPNTGNFFELDMYIPDLKIAIEFNGPSHYLPIFGEERLIRQLKNDSIKRSLCSDLGIYLIEVKLPSGKHFDRSTSELTQLKSLIDHRLNEHLSGSNI